MTNEAIEKTKLKALETEIARNQAEQRKIEKETEELTRNIKTTFLGISLSALIKTVIAAIVAGYLFGDVIMTYYTKINAVNEKLLQQTEKEKQESEKKLIELTKKSKKLEIEKDEFRQQLSQAVSESEILAVETGTDTSTPTKVKSVATIEKLQSQWVEQAHNLEQQQAILPKLPQAQPKPKPPPVTGTQTGWVYLGEYKNGKWITKYFDFSGKLKPDHLVNTKSRVDVNAINVRNEKFSGE